MGFQQLSMALVVMIMMMMMILQKPNCGRAAVVMKIDNTYQYCNGLVNEYKIGEDLELLMGSNVIRILQQAGNNKLSSNALMATQAVQKDCKGSYTNCIANGGNANCRNLFACRGQL
ncbi:hypothetical protein PTKIN_Ptkin12aG0019700 [Pterospermum kingtungense]